MKKALVPPYYLKIAHDIANRISTGEFVEGQKIYGRSIMASEYNASPETIRRALKLLADMKVIEIKPQSGAIVLSRDNAARYIHNFGDDLKVHKLMIRLRELKQQCEELNEMVFNTVDSIVQTRYSFAATGEALPNYEVRVPENSWLIGKSIAELKFWQSTGGTIIAIKRGQNIIVSPGPYAELYDDDLIVLVGTSEAAEAAHRFMTEKEAANDSI